MLNETILLLLPVELDSAPKIILPQLILDAAVDDPSIVQLVIVLLDASFLNLIVQVPVVALAVVLAIIKLFPPVFKPSIITLSAPFKSINGEPAVIAPETVLVAPPVGCI